MSGPEETTDDQLAVLRAYQALRLATASLPHLSGLARLVRVKATDRVNVAAIAASGLLVVRPQYFTSIPLVDAAFIMAHELMHLALDTHNRRGESHPLISNFAHDYLINDILHQELEREPPLGGLFAEGSRHKSFEQLVVELCSNASTAEGERCWWPDTAPGAAGSRQPPPPSPISRALSDAGLIPPPDVPPPPPPMDEDLLRGDLLSSDHEALFEPELSAQQRQTMAERVRQAAAKAASLDQLKKSIDAANTPTKTIEPERHEATMQALRAAYRTPWQLALQRWMDAVVPGERTFARPSRRGSNRSDVVLPGRRREGWTLHVILDTSGSMESHLPIALGAIAYFCDSAGVNDIHVVQCDVEVTRDDWVEPAALAEFKVAGFGYSDMRPAMRSLADDPEVSAVLMLTDGWIDYLPDEPPYSMLWVLLGEVNNDFAPPHGQVVHLSD